MGEAGSLGPARSELHLRVLSALAMAVIALGSAWWGGLIFDLVWGGLALGVLGEWLITLRQDALHKGSRHKGGASPAPIGLELGLLTGFFVSLLLAFANPGGHVSVFFPVILGGMALAFSLFHTERRRWSWLIAGYVYAAAMLVSVLLLRHAQPLGLVAILFLFAIVWASDIFAYFAGRLIGGPKLAPRISPKKTWAGMAGGLVGGVGCGLALLAFFAIPPTPKHLLVALALALASVVGDLFESWFKRVFGVKDSGVLIPGHGGVMDRLDGFVFAASLAALIGAVHARGADLASGLLLW